MSKTVIPTSVLKSFLEVEGYDVPGKRSPEVVDLEGLADAVLDRLIERDPITLDNIKKLVRQEIEKDDIKEEIREHISNDILLDITKMSIRLYQLEEKIDRIIKIIGVDIDSSIIGWEGMCLADHYEIRELKNKRDE